MFVDPLSTSLLFRKTRQFLGNPFLQRASKQLCMKEMSIYFCVFFEIVVHQGGLGLGFIRYLSIIEWLTEQHSNLCPALIGASIGQKRGRSTAHLKLHSSSFSCPLHTTHNLYYRGFEFLPHSFQKMVTNIFLTIYQILEKKYNT